MPARRGPQPSRSHARRTSSYVRSEAWVFCGGAGVIPRCTCQKGTSSINGFFCGCQRYLHRGPFRYNAETSPTCGGRAGHIRRLPFRPLLESSQGLGGPAFLPTAPPPAYSSYPTYSHSSPSKTRSTSPGWCRYGSGSAPCSWRRPRSSRTRRRGGRWSGR
jgi:hypothetical protein